MTETTLQKYDYYSPIYWLSWLIAQPIKLVVRLFKPLPDPEKVQCPCCGFRGDSGTGGKSCKIQCVEVADAAKFMIKHTCLRDGAEFYSKPLIPASQWAAHAPKPLPRALLTRS